jgi:hypothetical protein
MQVDMRSGLIRGQRTAVEAGELVEVGVARSVTDSGETYFDQAVGRLRCGGVGGCG